MTGAVNRTGELCPFCRKGKLYPTGERDILEPATTPKSGEIHRESTEYECDSCYLRTQGSGLGLIASILTSFKIEVSDDKKIDKDEKCKEQSSQ